MIVQCAVRQDIKVDISSDGQCVHPSSNTIRWVYLQYHVTDINVYTFTKHISQIKIQVE